MILKGIQKYIEKEKKEGDFLYPFYGKYCFSNIPSTILDFFGIETRRTKLPSELYNNEVEMDGNDKLVLIIIDGFGFNQWLRYHKQHEFFEHNEKHQKLEVKREKQKILWRKGFEFESFFPGIKCSQCQMSFMTRKEYLTHNKWEKEIKKGRKRPVFLRNNRRKRDWKSLLIVQEK